MSYIEKEKLIKADIASIENRVRHAFNQGYDLGYKEGKANCSKIPTGSTTKNDLGVDCIDRQATLDAIIKRLGIKNETYLLEAERVIYQQILAMPSVTPQEPFINKPCVSSGVCEHDKNKVLDKIDEIITDALDKSTDQKESQTLRWVLDKISENT